ncbi:MAG: relaxase/mobilization nuclease domain-containing protein [Lachnospiraceae bacterium]|nr:relaxase/mobilization nuclease domain-containing protein [Lachnospiraceae bacterium]
MAKGIVAKIWNIKEGSMGRSGGAQITDSISYITDEEKCDEHLAAVTALGSIEADSSMKQIGRELTYVTNEVKTLHGVYIGCKNVSDIRNATAEMMQVKQFFGKTGGRVALHGIISLDEEESDKKNAGKLMLLLSDLLDRVFPDHQAVYAVHTNTENLHIHFIVNTVGLHGKKIHMDNRFMKDVFEKILNELALKYGFTPNEAWIREKPVKTVVPFAKRIMDLRQAVDEAIERSNDYDSFLNDLKEQGIQVRSGKHLSLKTEGMSRAIRSYRLGSRYTVENIADRILKKREELIRSEVGDHVKEKSDGAGAYFMVSPLKRYRDMTKAEKMECIHKLRLGRNPWKERYESNWQMEKMADEFHRTANVYELIRTYAPDGSSAQAAMNHIVELQKQIMDEKKRIREHLRDYQPIVKLYEQAREVMTKAWLYEFSGKEEYKAEYEEYKTLCQRLWDGYEKSVDEVAEFLADQNGQLMYATAQSRELSGIYKTIKRFKEREMDETISEYVSLYEAVGFGNARYRAESIGVFESSIRYIAAEGADGGFIRVVITPDEVEGKRTERAEITVFDEKSNKIKAFSTADMSIKEFNAQLSQIKSEMGLYRCHTFDDKKSALRYALEQADAKSAKAGRRPGNRE